LNEKKQSRLMVLTKVKASKVTAGEPVSHLAPKMLTQASNIFLQEHHPSLS